MNYKKCGEMCWQRPSLLCKTFLRLILDGGHYPRVNIIIHKIIEAYMISCKIFILHLYINKTSCKCLYLCHIYLPSNISLKRPLWGREAEECSGSLLMLLFIDNISLSQKGITKLHLAEVAFPLL